MKDAGKKGDGRIAGFIFSGAIVLCCIALFLLSDVGGDFIENLGTAPSSADKTSLPAISEETSDGFFASAEKIGFDFEYTLAEKNERFEKYEVALTDGFDAELTLTLNDGVSAFTLSAPLPTKPRDMAEDESLIAGDLREKEEKECETYFAALHDAFIVLALSLDASGGTTYSTADGFFAEAAEIAWDADGASLKSSVMAFAAHSGSGRLSLSCELSKNGDNE